MAPRNTVLPSGEDQRQMASNDLGFSKAVRGETQHVSGTTASGQRITAAYGQIQTSDAPQTDAPTAGRPTDPQYHNLLVGLRNRLAKTGVQPASILNFLPIPLVVNSPMADLRVRILPAPRADEERGDFSSFTWTHATAEVVMLGEGNRMPWDIHPVQFAEAFMNEYKDFGGVVLIMGHPDERTLAQDDVQRDIADAKELMHRWMVRKVEEANGFWNTPNGQDRGNIVELHRLCARTLKDGGLIDNLPDWIVEARNVKDVQKKCPACGLMPQIGAARCACTYVLDPAKAFMIGDITEEDASLERLTRAVVEELGISAYVSETSDEKPARLKRGAPKPMSIAQRNAQDAHARAVGSQPDAL